MMMEVFNNNPVMFYSSIVLFAVISWAIYKFVLTANNSNNTATTTSSQAAATSSSAVARGGGLSAGNNNNGSSGGTANNNNNNNKEEEDAADSVYTYRYPPHLNIPQSQQQPSIDLSSSHLYQGIIPFRSTFASGYETRLLSSSSSSSSKKEEEENIIIINRKSRARIFAKIFSIKLASDRPPGRGSNMVVVISYNGNVNSFGRNLAKCEKLQKSLMLLSQR